MKTKKSPVGGELDDQNLQLDFGNSLGIKPGETAQQPEQPRMIYPPPCQYCGLEDGNPNCRYCCSKFKGES